MTEPHVSIVVPVRSPTHGLSKLLASIGRQTVKVLEIIVVASGPALDTRALPSDCPTRIISVECGMSEGRNIGARASSGRYLCFLDEDMVLGDDVVGQCVGAIDLGADAVIVPEASFGVGFWAQCKALEKQCYVGDDAIESPRFMTQQVFQDVGGYDQSLTAGEDMDMALRIRSRRNRIVRVSALIYHDEGRLTLRDDLRKKIRYGRTLHLYAKKHPQAFARQRRLLRPAFLRNWRLLARRPIVGSATVFLKFAEFCAYGIGMMGAEGSE